MTDPVALLIDQGLTIAVAESLTGGQLVASLIDTPGASAVVLGGVVAYNTALKETVLGVPSSLLEERGAVDPEVARRMASGVRTALSVAGRPADVGLATTGVAGPDSQDGQPVGTVWVGLAIGDRVDAYPFLFEGGRGDIRQQTVSAARDILVAALLRD
jgi:nicotinamide-nucleotide amidase